MGSRWSLACASTEPIALRHRTGRRLDEPELDVRRCACRTIQGTSDIDGTVGVDRHVAIDAGVVRSEGNAPNQLNLRSGRDVCDSGKTDQSDRRDGLAARQSCCPCGWQWLTSSKFHLSPRTLAAHMAAGKPRSRNACHRLAVHGGVGLRPASVTTVVPLAAIEEVGAASDELRP